MGTETGKIIRGVGGFYYVATPDAVYECKAKGIFRKDDIKPLVGDDVEMSVLDEEATVLAVGHAVLPKRIETGYIVCANVEHDGIFVEAFSAIVGFHKQA